MKRPKDEPNTFQRIEGVYYTLLCIRPSNATTKDWKNVYFFPDPKEPTGYYRYETDFKEWYVDTAIEKLNKLPSAEQSQITASVAMGLRHAIRERYQKSPGARALELPNCRNTLSAVDKWIKGVWKKYGPDID